MENAIFISGTTLILIVMGWIVVEVRAINDKLDSKVDVHDLDACRKGCHGEHKQIWERVNRHGHTEGGKVTIES